MYCRTLCILETIKLILLIIPPHPPPKALRKTSQQYTTSILCQHYATESSEFIIINSVLSSSIDVMWYKRQQLSVRLGLLFIQRVQCIELLKCPKGHVCSVALDAFLEVLETNLTFKLRIMVKHVEFPVSTALLQVHCIFKYQCYQVKALNVCKCTRVSFQKSTCTLTSVNVLPKISIIKSVCIRQHQEFMQSEIVNNYVK